MAAMIDRRGSWPRRDAELVQVKRGQPVQPGGPDIGLDLPVVWHRATACATSRAARSGSASASRAPRCRSAPAVILAAVRPPGRGTARRPHGDEVLRRGARRRLIAHLRIDLGGVGGRRLSASEHGPDRVVPYVFPTAGMLDGLPLRDAGGHARPARAGLLRHHDAGRAGQLGGDPGGGRRRADRGRSGRRRRRLAYAICRPPGHHAGPRRYGGSCYLNNAAVAAAGAAREPAPSGSPSSTSTPTTATARRRSSTTVPTCTTAACTSIRAPAGSRTTPGSPTSAGAAPAKARTATCRWPQAPATAAGWPPSTSSAPTRARRGVDVVVVARRGRGAGRPESPLQVTSRRLRPAGERLGRASRPDPGRRL